VSLTALDYLAAAGAAGAAGAINALAGGGSLVSFPTLVGLGVPAVAANVTNTVALLPGYLAGSWAQRDDVRPQLRAARVLAVAAVVGGLAGSVLLVSLPGRSFRVAVPYLILASCALLLGQDRLRDWVRPAVPAAPPAGSRPAPVGSPPPAPFAAPGPVLVLSVFAAAVYGGFFGAGLGIMLLAVLGLFRAGSLIQVNALKQVLSFVINLVAAGFFAFSGHVRWELVPVMAAASLLGGAGGGRLVTVIDGVLLRRLVVVAGVGVAVAFWVSS
jgi:hypothetical protein